MKVTKKDVAAVTAVAFPEYAGRKYGLRAATTVVTDNLNWDGGSRNQYVAVALDESGRVNRLDVPAPWLHKGEGAVVEIPAGWCVVEHTYFCGRDCGLTVHARPESVAKLLGERAEVRS